MARNQGQDVSDVSPSFFKVMYGENYAKVLYIPPKFAPVITKLNGRKTYLEDSLGAKWEVTVSEVDGFLAFEQGWNDFFVGHGVEYGDFLIFNYMETYFDVEIYNKSLVQRGEFPNSSQTKKKTQIDRECSSPLNDRMKPTKRLMKRQNSRKRIMESDEADSDGESPSLYWHSKDRSQSKGNNVEGDVCEKTPEFKRQNVEIDVGGKENPSSSCSEIQPKRDFVEESFFGFAWKGDKNTDNEARTAVLDLSEVELWGGCCLNQSGGIKASADRNGFGATDQGASYHGVRTDETSDCASEVTAKVGPAAEMFQNKWKSVAPNTPKDTYHNLSGDHPRKPESTDTASGPVSAEKKAHMSPADHQEHDYNKRVPAAVSGPSIKKERVEIDALPINLTKNKPTAQEKALIATKMEPKVEPYWAPEPLRAVATNRFFLELPLELPCESLQRKKVAERVVLLQDPCKRLWPVSYNTTKKFLSQGWEDFLNGNGVQLGDECILSFKGNFVYGVSIVKKQRVT